ncbi:MAG: hypothetical protein HUJ26_15885 [Planctomycetaceae bacterium]|nr:hypothetical protein [Planctomycetaceae bacterium]
MPLTLNVNISKKVGEPDYGSRGASVSLQQELDTTLVQQPQQLQSQIQQLFRQARDAVETELFGRTASQNGASSNGNGLHSHQQPASRNGRRATQSQVKAIYAIANQQRLDLNGILSQQFQVERPEDLSLREASQLIDDLKGAETGGRR